MSTNKGYKGITDYGKKKILDNLVGKHLFSAHDLQLCILKPKYVQNTATAATIN